MVELDVEFRIVVQISDYCDIYIYNFVVMSRVDVYRVLVLSEEYWVQVILFIDQGDEYQF